MKATFEFALPEEQEEYRTMEQADRLEYVVRELLDGLRQVRKYEECEMFKVTKKNIATFAEIEQVFYKLLSDNDVKGF